MKRVLIISYYWPPAGGISVLRALKFAKYLNKFGWDVVVASPSGASYSILDEGNFKDIPPHLEEIKIPIWEPFDLFKKVSGRKPSESANPVYQRDKKQSVLDKISIWIRGNFFIPDARAFWIRPAVKTLTKYLEQHPVDVLLTDGPPHTNTEIASRLSAKLGIPWLADFQDPWTQVDYYSMMKISPMADKIHRKMEQRAFKRASKITIVSPSWKRDLESIGATNVNVVYWGYDEDDFKGLSENNQQTATFNIIHAGTVGFDRLPDTFFHVLQEILTENNFAQRIQVDFYGPVDFELKTIVHTLALDEHVHFHGNVDRKQVLEKLQNADLQLLLLNKAKNAQGRLPGKLFEYLRAKTPILGLGLEESDAQDILHSTGTGRVIEYNDHPAIKSFLLEHLQGQAQFLPKGVEEFSSENQIGKIHTYLEELISKDNIRG